MRVRFKVGDSPWYYRKNTRELVQIHIERVIVDTEKETVFVEHLARSEYNGGTLMVSVDQAHLYKTSQLAERAMWEEIQKDHDDYSDDGEKVVPDELVVEENSDG